ncbi:MAG: Dyp-type peroxidase [Actinobacteria bacterium]|nr:Dyp-type peroxidase [Actinomycetota bacterium]
MSDASHLMQEGIAFESGMRPAPCYRLVLLNVAAGTSVSAAANALEAVTRMLRELASGRVRELEGQPSRQTEASEEHFSGLRSLLGYGRRFFDCDVHEPALTELKRSDFLSYLPGPPAAFPSIPWAREDDSNPGEADIAIQLTGDRESAVSCAAVEIWKLVVDERLPLEVVSSFAGFGRLDGRGWLEFHDGVSNLDSSQRLETLEALADPAWMEGGTYMAFLRLAVDLALWRSLERSAQELIVGRDKLSGIALRSVDREGGRACPVVAPAGGGDPSAVELAEWRDPPQTTDPLLEASHVHRSNQNRASSGAPGGLRIFRQGYDYLNGLGPGGPALGLNFVSFQSDLRALHHALYLPGWLGDANFGGPVDPHEGDPPSPPLLALVAGGLYAVPPTAEPFPGAGLLGR